MCNKLKKKIVSIYLTSPMGEGRGQERFQDILYRFIQSSNMQSGVYKQLNRQIDRQTDRLTEDKRQTLLGPMRKERKLHLLLMFRNLIPD